MLGDSAQSAVHATTHALREAFDPHSSLPPLGGGSERVRVIAGDNALPVFDFHATGGCDEPFLWVRLIRRYRTVQFPAPTAAGTCGTQIAVAIELGVGRCAVVDARGIAHCDNWTPFDDEAETSLDDSWRIELAMCRASKLIKDKNYGDAVALDTIETYGPEGGVIAWFGTMYVLLG